MKRREFITLLGGAAAWPLAARAQSKRMRQIGVLMGLVANDPEAQSRVVAFENGLQELGWVKGRNLSIEYRWAGDGNVLRDHAAELFAMIGPLGDSLEEIYPMSDFFGSTLVTPARAYREAYSP